MPTYLLTDPVCGEYTEWLSIHADLSPLCPRCGQARTKIITPPALYGVGDRGRETRETDLANRTLSKDLPAYKRFRDHGVQPQAIDGCDRLEATAASAFEVESKGILKGDERQIKDAMEYARDIERGRA